MFSKTMTWTVPEVTKEVLRDIVHELQECPLDTGVVVRVGPGGSITFSVTVTRESWAWTKNNPVST